MMSCLRLITGHIFQISQEGLIKAQKWFSGLGNCDLMHQLHSLTEPSRRQWKLRSLLKLEHKI